MDRLIRRVNLVLARRSKLAIYAIVVGLLGVVGVLDVLTGVELSLAVFYLLPVSVASWYGNRRAGLVVAILAAATWFVADTVGGHAYTHPAIPYWNALVRFGFFAITAHLLARVRELLDVQTRLARRDGLTNVLNARAFFEQGTTLFRLADRSFRPVAVGVLDVDGFKGMNDTHGHSAGDDVLIAVARTMKQALRETDLLARMGGDEFAVLLPDSGQAGAREAFQRMHATLVALAEEHQWPVGFSIGVNVVYPPLPLLEDVVRGADDLMYTVKGGSKNDVLLRESGNAP